MCFYTTQPKRTMMFLCLKPDGDVCEVKRSLNPKFVVGDTTLGLQYLKGVVETKGRGKIERLCSWDFQGNTVYMYGWRNGADDIVSCHSLPKPLDKERVYGDILCFMTATTMDEDGTPPILDFTEAMYLDFFQWVTCDIDAGDEEDSEDEDEAEDEAKDADIDDADEEDDDADIEIEIEDAEDTTSPPTSTVDKIIQEIVKKSRRGGVRGGKGATTTKMYNYQFMDLCVADNELEMEAEYVVVG